MKALRFALPVALPLVLLACSPPVLAQSQSPAQKSFQQIKSLAGTWEGTVTTFPATDYQGKHLQVRLRVVA